MLYWLLCSLVFFLYVAVIFVRVKKLKTNINIKSARQSKREQDRERESNREQQRTTENKREQERARGSKKEKERARESKRERETAGDSKRQQERARKRGNKCRNR